MTDKTNKFWCKVKKYILYMLLFIIIGIIFLVGVPIIINESYRHIEGYPTVWGGEDVLSFYGILLGGLITVIGIYLTLKQNQKLTEKTLEKSDNKAKEDRRLSVLPLITINKMEREFAKDDWLTYLIEKWLEEKEERDEPLIPLNDNLKYSEYKLEQIIICFENDDIKLHKKLTDKQKETISERWTYKNKSLYENKCLYIPLYISNAGVGVVVNMKIQIYKNDEYQTGYESINLKTGEDFYIYFFSEDINNFKCEDNYLINFIYFDINGNRYQQSHDIKFNDEEKTYSINTTIKQELLN